MFVDRGASDDSSCSDTFMTAAVGEKKTNDNPKVALDELRYNSKFQLIVATEASIVNARLLPDPLAVPAYRFSRVILPTTLTCCFGIFPPVFRHRQFLFAKAPPRRQVQVQLLPSYTQSHAPAKLAGCISEWRAALAVMVGMNEPILL